MAQAQRWSDRVSQRLVITVVARCTLSSALRVFLFLLVCSCDHFCPAPMISSAAYTAPLHLQWAHRHATQ